MSKCGSNKECQMLIRRNELSAEADKIINKIFDIKHKSKMLDSIFTFSEYLSLKHFIEVVYLDVFTCSHFLKEILENFISKETISLAEELRLAVAMTGVFNYHYSSHRERTIKALCKYIERTKLEIENNFWNYDRIMQIEYYSHFADVNNQK